MFHLHAAKGPGVAKQLAGTTASGILAVLLFTGALAILLWYCGQQQRKKSNSRILIRNKKLVDEFILR